MQDLQTDLAQLILCITEIVYRHGHRDYLSNEQEEELVVARLCGLDVLLKGKISICINANDVELSVNSSPSVAANDEIVPTGIDSRSIQFDKGGLDELSSWYKRLAHLDNCLCQTNKKIVCFPQAA